MFHPDIFRSFRKIRFFDYTKNPTRMKWFLQRREWPGNYHLTFSAQPNNHQEARRILEQGGTVAVVFWPEIPGSFWGFPVVNGDDPVDILASILDFHPAVLVSEKGKLTGIITKSNLLKL